ncbi:MAG: HaeIII family restriction endonuclease [Cytophagales bacterium]|nr:HaeIII family restriction endonuclease [Cytophagales bacterium]
MEAIVFLQAYDDRFNVIRSVAMQSDMKGRYGDVRDIILHTKNDEEIGISAKHRHASVKHSRLSKKIDFGKEWYGVSCSAAYWSAVNPVFQDLEERRLRKERWRDVPEKAVKYYVPVLSAFKKEVEKHAKVDTMIEYLIGKYDFYQIIKENGYVLLNSVNLHGTLLWGKKLPLPSMISSIMEKNNTTLILKANSGWEMSFRIHNARTIIEPSLKFDVQLIGVPKQLLSHRIKIA